MVVFFGSSIRCWKGGGGGGGRKNEKRDPVPFFRHSDSFIYNGIFYREQGLKIIKDDMGIVFTNNEDAVIKFSSESFALYRKALQAKQYCNYILNTDIDIETLKYSNDLK